MALPLKHDPDLGSRSLHDLWADPANAATRKQVLLRFDHIRRRSKLAQQQLNRFVEMFGPQA
jgi:hypothetical protein